MAMYYSREERKVALQLHLEQNKSISETIKILGYPERTTLFRWLKIYRDESQTIDMTPHQIHVTLRQAIH